MTSKNSKPDQTPDKKPVRKNTPKPNVPAPISADARDEEPETGWLLRLFVAGQSPKSLLAYSNLKKICEQNLAGKYRIELVDLIKEPHLAQTYQIVAIPTLIRQLPEPVKRLIGDLSDHQRALVGMDLGSN